MTIVAEFFNFVVGVDTHAVTHTYSVVDARTGAEQQRATFPTAHLRTVDLGIDARQPLTGTAAPVGDRFG